MSSDFVEAIKQVGAYPVSITLIGIIAIIVTLPKESRNLYVEVGIVLLFFIVLTIFNTLYFRWYRKSR